MDDDDERKGLDDHEAQEELGSRKTVREHGPCQPSAQKRIEHEMTHLPFTELVWTLLQAERTRGGLSESN